MRQKERAWDRLGWKRAGSGAFHQCLQIPEGRVEKGDPGSSQWCPRTGREATGTN